MSMPHNNLVPDSVEHWQTILADHQYIAERSLATAIYLSGRLSKPLFVEGEAGVGKTEIAKVLTEVLERPLIRLQCYEGLDVSSALYEWNYAQQILQIRIWEAAGQLAASDCGQPASHKVRDIFNPHFLLKQPLLQATNRLDGAPVLLIDELDRADGKCEAFLLELLGEFQINVPELGTLRAPQPSVEIITTNRNREIHNALKLRSLYHWIDYPSMDKEYRIVRARVPDVPEYLARQVEGAISPI